MQESCSVRRESEAAMARALGMEAERRVARGGDLGAEETKPSEQAQVDFGRFPFLTPAGQR
jgi:hypothetical protein